jgi:parallel beta-helix repeat protein
MAVNLSFIGGAGWQFFNDAGVPLSGGKIYTYVAGTTTPLTTYTSRDGLTPNANPIILDAAGRTPQQIWATEGLLYKYVVTTSTDVQIRVWDNIGGSVVASNLAQDLANTTDNAKGDALIGFKQSNSSGFLAGATARTVNNKLQEFVSVKDFGAVGDGVTDDTAAIQAAANAVGNNGTLYFSSGTYCLGAAGLDLASRTGFTLLGDGTATIKITAISTLIIPSLGVCSIRFTNCVQSGVKNLVIDGNNILSAAVGFSACTECFIYECTVHNSGASTAQIIASNGGVRNRFINNLIYAGNSTARGMWLGNVTAGNMETGIYVSANMVRDNPASGIVASSIGGVIEQNCLLSNEGAGIVLPGFFGLAARDLVISNNYCEDNLFHGIQSDVFYATDDDLSANITVTGNVCVNHNRNASSSGIYLVYSRNWTVVGNICRNNLSAGIYAGNRVLNSSIMGNTCLDTGSGASRTQNLGIAVIADGGLIANVVVSGNVCHNNLLRGIFVTTTSPFTLTNITVNSNVTSDNGAHGIFIAEALTGEISNAAVAGNVCSNNATQDLRLSLKDVAIGLNRYTTQLGVDFYTFDDLSTTPSVVGRQFWRANNSAATAITAFNNGVDGQQITIRSTNANTTIVNSGSLLNKGGVNAALPANGIISYVRQGTVWFEMSRSF